MKTTSVRKEQHHRPQRLNDLIAWLQDRLAEIPSDYRNDAEFDIDYDDGIDTIIYWREETAADLENDKLEAEARVKRLQLQIDTIRKNNNL